MLVACLAMVDEEMSLNWLMHKTGSVALLASLFFAATTPMASAAELLMLERKGCEWCQRWHAEIGPIYPKTEEARIAPLTLVDIDDPWPERLTGIRRDIFTPTFVLVEDGVEVARVRGYTGDEFFWFLIGEMIDKLPKTDKSSG
uniref:Sulfur/thiosulfate oxidation protein SoxS n=1 Tax=uncultured bacterium ws406H10 TaxID=1131831 RepID=I1X5D9_9BACT|nr:sulfur/thiosulfate oxidation protein SoxS [uncultured bacterium ws406H10]